MAPSLLASCLLLLLVLCIILPLTVSTDYHYDIVIFAATPGGISAAINAAKYDGALAVALVEESAHIGGMTSAGGIGLRDLGVEITINGTVARAYVDNNARYYSGNRGVYQPAMMYSEMTFYDLLAPYKNVVVHPNRGYLVSVTSSSTRIKTLTLSSADTFSGAVFIDASYEGDVVRLAKLSYTYGREANTTYNESYAGVRPYTSFGNFIPAHPVNATVNGWIAPFISSKPLAPIGSADDRMMGYSYRLCLSTNIHNQINFTAPNNYNSSDFIILQRYIDSFIANGKVDGPDITDLVDIFPYRGDPYGDRYDMCDSANSAFTSDALGLNEGYVTGSHEERQLIRERHRYYVEGFLYYIRSSPLVPAHTKRSLFKYGLCADTFADNRYYPYQMYVREGLRLVNKQMFTQNDQITGKCLSDSIALFSWAYDIHGVTRTARYDKNRKDVLIADTEGQLVADIKSLPGSKSGGVYEVPYSIIVPNSNECNNLLVPVCHAATHVAYSSTRVEPHFMMLGGVSGYAAAMAVKQNISVADVDVSAIQKQLISDGASLHYPPGHCDSVVIE